MKIRRSNIQDLPRIRAIYNQGVASRMATCDEDEKSLEERTVWYAQFNDQYPLFVLVDNEQVIGYGAIFPISPKSGYRFFIEHSVYIDEECHGRGLGRMMLNYLIKESKARGYTLLQARIFSHNPVSIKLHESVGFQLVGTLKKVANLDGLWFDVSIYTLDL